MNNVEIMGGLGNQFFQYVFARYLQKIGVKNVVLRKDFFTLTLLEQDDLTKREFLLDKYNTSYIMADGEKTYESYCDERQYDADEALKMDNVLYGGHYQDIVFYNEVKDDIKGELTLKDEYIDASMREIASEMAVCNSVALHIRRSDYLKAENLEVFEQLSMDYYSLAVSNIEKLTKEKPVLYIFSDDYEYIAANMNDFMGYKTVIMPERQPYQDMYLMTKTKHNIIANSTFSWWGATLNENPDNITIAPSKWMKGQQVSLYHDGWIIL